MTDTVTTINPAAVAEALLRLPGAEPASVDTYIDLTETVPAPVTAAPGLRVEAAAHDAHVRVRAFLPFPDGHGSTQFLEREIVPYEDHTSSETVVAAVLVLAEALALRVAGDALATNADFTRSHARAALAVIAAGTDASLEADTLTARRGFRQVSVHPTTDGHALRWQLAVWREVEASGFSTWWLSEEGPGDSASAITACVEHLRAD